MMHRDMKPDNLMLASDGTLKLIDFGMSKSYGQEVPLSQNQVTLYYRPPEILFGSAFYGPSADMWSVGCILAELLIKVPLFRGEHVLDQLMKIFTVRGTPDNDEEWVNVDLLQNFKKFNHFKATPL